MNEIIKAKYSEWLASIFGACFIAFGLGILLSTWLGILAWFAIVLGIAVHAWGMYKVNQRNKK